MLRAPMHVAAAPSGAPVYAGARIVWLGVLALLMLVPVTLPVTVLRGLVQERFEVSEFLTSLFMSVNMLGAVISAPLAGAIADRTRRRVPIVVGALLFDAVFLLSLAAPLSFPIFMALRFCEGAAHIVALSTLLGIAAEARGGAERGRVMGLTGGGIMLGVALGAPIGGAIGHADPRAPLYAGSALVAASALLAWRVLEETPESGPKPSLREIAAALRANPLLLAPLTFAFVDRFTVGFYTTTFSLFLSRIHDLAPARIGLLMACLMLPFGLLSYPFGRLAERWSRVAMISIGSVAYGIGTAAVAWSEPAWLPLLMGALGVASAVMFVPSLLITSDAAPAEIRTTAMGAFNAAGSFGFIVGPVTGGFVSERVAALAGWEAGYRAAFGVAGASAVASVVLALPFLLRLVRSGRTT
jgi:MFS family permease